MKALTDKKWGAFYISDEKENGIFKLRSSLSGIDKNKLLESDDKETPYITRSDFNNGVALFVGKEQSKKFKIDKGNVITIGLDTQTVFYQPHSFEEASFKALLGWKWCNFGKIKENATIIASRSK